MSKLKQIKINTSDFASLMAEINEPHNWRLVRENDGLVKQSTEVKWIEWNEDSTFKSEHKEPEIGRSLLMSPFNQFFSWQTTQIVTFKPIDNGFMFVTRNSNYTLTKIHEPSV
jgi:hypothetical protein